MPKPFKLKAGSVPTDAQRHYGFDRYLGWDAIEFAFTEAAYSRFYYLGNERDSQEGADRRRARAIIGDGFKVESTPEQDRLTTAFADALVQYIILSHDTQSQR